MKYKCHVCGAGKFVKCGKCGKNCCIDHQQSQPVQNIYNPGFMPKVIRICKDGYGCNIVAPTPNGVVG